MEGAEQGHVTRIVYFRNTRPLAEPEEASRLPADEASAAVLLAALLNRAHANRWTGQYGAVIDPQDGSRPVVIAEDDPRVLIARGLLLTIAGHGQYREDELTSVRATVLRLEETP